MDGCGLAGASRVLGISRSYVYELSKGVKKAPKHVVSKAIEVLGLGEAKKILGAGEMLRACGASYEDGPLDRMFIVEIPALASRDEILRRMELKKILGMVPERIELRWDDDFEEFLRERKRRMIATEETLKYYRNLFKKYLEGRELSR